MRETRERGIKILPQAARSSLTGGAIPQGEVVLSVDRLDQVGPIERWPGGARVTCGPGVRLSDLQARLATEGLYYPPIPTYQEAMLGGTVSTNAGGPTSFKYGVTRDWVQGLRVLLGNGDLLCLERGEAVARRGESFQIRLSDGQEIVVPTTEHRLPDLKKISAGYHAAERLDLVDLFIGSEGTLGLITGVTVELAPLPPALVVGFVSMAEQAAAFDLGAELRGTPGVRAIEWLDPHCLDLLRDSGDARSRRVGLPDDARAALLFEMELEQAMSDDDAQERLASLLEGEGAGSDDGLTRLFRTLRDRDALDRLEFAFPDDARRRRDLTGLREVLPQRAGELLARRRQSDPAVQKVGGDLIVPFDRLREMLEVYAEGFERRGLPFAVWGHFGDGNLHPNALPRSGEEVELALEAQLEFAGEATRRGGCPLSEHGVGRSPVKQEMLRRFVGNAAVARMRRIKKALDPESRFSPGVLFPAHGS